MTEAEIERLAEIVASRLLVRENAEAEAARMLDARGAAERLGVPATWLLAQARARRIPHRRFGKYVRFDTRDLDEIAASTLCSPRIAR